MGASSPHRWARLESLVQKASRVWRMAAIDALEMLQGFPQLARSSVHSPSPRFVLSLAQRISTSPAQSILKHSFIRRPGHRHHPPFPVDVANNDITAPTAPPPPPPSPVRPSASSFLHTHLPEAVACFISASKSLLHASQLRNARLPA